MFAYLCVDTFFFMGGFFSGYVMISKLKKINLKVGEKVFFYVFLILLRALRTLPVVIACSLFYGYIYPF